MQLTIDISEPLTEAEAAMLRVLLNGTTPEEKAAPKKAAKKASPKKAKIEPGPDDDDEDLREQAVQAATALLSDGKRDEVLAALKKAGAKRVSELEDDDIQTFLDALPD